jgi:hypothetical protein
MGAKTHIFAVIAAVFVIGHPGAQAGKLMRIAKWAGREAARGALQEYAKRIAGVSFDAFKVKFCSDKSFREKVLSSPKFG